MEDYILKEIDKIGLILQKIAIKLKIMDENKDNAGCTMRDIKAACTEYGLNFDPAAVLSEKHPVSFLANTLHLSDEALELFVLTMLHSDIPEASKQRLLSDAITYLDSKDTYSFSLHSMMSQTL